MRETYSVAAMDDQNARMKALYLFWLVYADSYDTGDVMFCEIVLVRELDG